MSMTTAVSMQFRRNIESFGYQFLRRSITTSVLKNASQVDHPATQAVGDLHLPEQEGTATKPTVEPFQSPVCAYNEWDPLEVSIFCARTATTTSYLRQ